MSNLLQTINAHIYKKIIGLSDICKTKAPKNKTIGRIKTNDRLTIIRLTQVLKTMALPAKITQKTTETVKHEKEKKITTTTKEIAINFPIIETSEEMSLLFSYFRNIIKYKIYKKFSLICYISMPSIRMNFTFNEGKYNTQPYILSKN